MIEEKQQENQNITLLDWLLDNWYSVYDDFLEILKNIECGYTELEAYKKNPSSYDEEEIEFLKIDVKDWENEIANIKKEFFKNRKNVDWENEVERVKEWWKDKESYIEV